MKQVLCSPTGGCRCIEITDYSDAPEWATTKGTEIVYVYDTDYPGIALVIKIDEERLKTASIDAVVEKFKSELERIEKSIEMFKKNREKSA